MFARVLGAFRERGGEATIRDGEKDENGEDRLVQYRGENITIQIVAASPTSSFWAQAARGHGHVEVAFDRVGSWIHAAIKKKASRYGVEQKRTMLLAIDMRHLGVLVIPALVSAYLREYGSPDHFGFGGLADRAHRPQVFAARALSMVMPMLETRNPTDGMAQMPPLDELFRAATILVDELRLSCRDAQ